MNEQNMITPGCSGADNPDLKSGWWLVAAPKLASLGRALDLSTHA